jgi:hypothetical protein
MARYRTDTMDGEERDWVKWHRAYDVAGSPLAVRLQLVRAYIEGMLDEAPPGPIRIVSLCSGQGRDVIEAVRSHDRRADVHARLVELDPQNSAMARALADQYQLMQVETVTGDASVSNAFVGAAPARVVVACGILGNIRQDDIRRFIGLVPMLCETGAGVVWTRHRRPPDLTPTIRRWFTESGFEEIGFDSPADQPFVGVGAARWPGAAGVVREGVGFFEFVGDSVPPPWEL